jgi:hypothetical protein
LDKIRLVIHYLLPLLLDPPDERLPDEPDEPEDPDDDPPPELKLPELEGE